MENYVNNPRNCINMKEKLSRLHRLFQLKEIERAGKVLNRMESSAEHTWSTMILAEYFLKIMDHDLDELKVLKLILYHDVVEIEAGDFKILERPENKKELELKAFEKLKTQIPSILADEYSLLFDEYENATSKEAEFAKAIDVLEPMIHWLNDKEAWKTTGFTEENLRKHKQKYLEKFPSLLDFFNQMIEYLKQEDFI